MVTLVVSPSALHGDRVEVEGDEYRHLFRALRLGPGDALRVVDGRGGARFGRVDAIERRRAWVCLDSPAPSNEPARRVELAIATIRPERAAWAVEKATEVGAVAVHWFGCERAPRRYGEGQLERLRRVAVAAVGQCGRSVVPEVGTLTWEALLARVSSRSTVVLDPGGEPPAVAGGDPGLLIVGPEGGLCAAELDALVAAGAVRRRLGTAILRTETAAVLACGIAVCSTG